MILRGTRFCFIWAASLFQHLFNDPRSSKERFSVLYSNYIIILAINQLRRVSQLDFDPSLCLRCPTRDDDLVAVLPLALVKDVTQLGLCVAKKAWRSCDDGPTGWTTEAAPLLCQVFHWALCCALWFGRRPSKSALKKKFVFEWNLIKFCNQICALVNMVWLLLIEMRASAQSLPKRSKRKITFKNQ